MDLVGCDNFNLVYVLTDTPDKLIQQEVSKIIYKASEDISREEVENAVRKELTFSDVPFEKRIKIFNIKHDPDIIQKAKDKIDLCREYYKSISL